jgi:hypothetical protein
VITATPGGVEEVLRLIATSGDQLNLVALADKYAVRLIGPPLLARSSANSQRAQKRQMGAMP